MNFYAFQDLILFWGLRFKWKDFSSRVTCNWVWVCFRNTSMQSLPLFPSEIHWAEWSKHLLFFISIIYKIIIEKIFNSSTKTARKMSRLIARTFCIPSLLCGRFIGPQIKLNPIVNLPYEWNSGEITQGPIQMEFVMFGPNKELEIYWNKKRKEKFVWFDIMIRNSL